MTGETHESIEGEAGTPLEETSSNVNTEAVPPPEPQGHQPHDATITNTIKEATETDTHSTPFESPNHGQTKNLSAEELGKPIRRKSKPTQSESSYGASDTNYDYTSKTGDRPVEDIEKSIARKTPTRNNSGIEFEKDQGYKNYADLMEEQLAEGVSARKTKEDSDKQKLEDYKKNRGAVGRAMDLFSREHTQEMGYAAEQKVEGYLKKRRAEKALENKKQFEPLLIQNDQNLREGKINKEMHAVREKQYLEKMEDITPLEEKIGKGVKREAGAAFGILNEAMTSPEGRRKINEQRVKEGKEPLSSAMDDNSISATFARGLASTSKQLHTKPAKSQPAIFTRGTEAPKFGGAAMHTLPTSGSFYGMGVGINTVPRKGKGSRSGVSQKGGNPINFGGVGAGGFGGGGAPITFAGGFGLFGRGQPAPAPAPVKRKKR